MYSEVLMHFSGKNSKNSETKGLHGNIILHVVAVQTMKMALDMLQKMTQLERLNLDVKERCTDPDLIVLSKTLQKLQHLKASLQPPPIPFACSII